jgi:hypothetical protein
VIAGQARQSPVVSSLNRTIIYSLTHLSSPATHVLFHFTYPQSRFNQLLLILGALSGVSKISSRLFTYNRFHGRPPAPTFYLMYHPALDNVFNFTTHESNRIHFRNISHKPSERC